MEIILDILEINDKPICSQQHAGPTLTHEHTRAIKTYIHTLTSPSHAPHTEQQSLQLLLAVMWITLLYPPALRVRVLRGKAKLN